MNPPTDAAAELTVADRLVDAAAQLLSEQGPSAITARRLADAAHTSTMAVYTHFGGMDLVLAEVLREGFRRFGKALAQPRTTEDAVADWMCQGWAYRHFAHTEPHLYRSMFNAAGPTAHGDEADAEAAFETFLSLTGRIERCAEHGRWEVDDTMAAGRSIWGAVHGLVSIELMAHLAPPVGDSQEIYEGTMRRIAIGFGDDPSAAASSARRARRRAQRAGHL